MRTSGPHYADAYTDGILSPVARDPRVVFLPPVAGRRSSLVPSTRGPPAGLEAPPVRPRGLPCGRDTLPAPRAGSPAGGLVVTRSEERRVGKECRSRW